MEAIDVFKTKNFKGSSMPPDILRKNISVKSRDLILGQLPELLQQQSLANVSRICQFKSKP